MNIEINNSRSCVCVHAGGRLLSGEIEPRAFTKRCFSDARCAAVEILLICIHTRIYIYTNAVDVQRVEINSLSLVYDIRYIVAAANIYVQKLIILSRV